MINFKKLDQMDMAFVPQPPNAMIDKSFSAFLQKRKQAKSKKNIALQEKPKSTNTIVA